MLLPLSILYIALRRLIIKLVSTGSETLEKVSDSSEDLNCWKPSKQESNVNCVDSTTTPEKLPRSDPHIDMYCWGSNDYGQLGLGSENRYIKNPSPIDTNQSIISIAAGLRHTIYLTANRNVYSCGSNEFGQLGQQKSQCRPSTVNGLGNEDVFHVASGNDFSIAITENGELYGWGRSQHGQLMCIEDSIHTPKLLQEIAQWTIVQVACGAEHCLALSEEGVILAWGRNDQGQLGLGNRNLIYMPTVVTSLSSLPVCQVFCGAHHSGVLSPSGTIYVWGRNNWGQLGIGNTDSSNSPVQVKALRNQNVEFVAMGEEHSVCRTRKGRVFSWGHGGNGQLGHGHLTNQNTPRMVIELMGSFVCQLCCGRRHTVSLTDQRKVIGFGLNSGSQLGPINDNTVRLPITIPVTLQGNRLVTCISAGGDQSFSGSMDESSCLLSLEDLRASGFKKPRKYCTRLSKVFNNLENGKLSSLAQRELTSIFSSSSSLNSSFLSDDHWDTSTRYSGVSLSKCSAALVHLFRYSQSRELIMSSLQIKLIPSLPTSPPDIETLRLHLTIPVCFHFAKQYSPPNLSKCIVDFARASNLITGPGEKVLKYWYGNVGQLYFSRILNVFKSDIESYIAKTPPCEYRKTDYLLVVCTFLKRLYDVNEQEKILSYDQFYLKGLNSNSQSLFEDYKLWRTNAHQHGRQFSFCMFPFVYDSPAKASLLRVDSQIHQLQNVNWTRQRNAQNFLTALIGESHLRSEAVVLNISREKILSDTVHQITHLLFHESDGVKALHKPLIVQFRGEEARDANHQSEAGVRREFFMLLIEALLDPTYGMTEEDDESHLVWFRGSSMAEFGLEDIHQDFFLFGIVCALAIYNDNIVDIHFPFALYKKLLGKTPELSDLKELHPSVGQSMDRILQATADDCIEDWGLTFSVERREFDFTTEVDLVPGGREIPVTLDNRKDYVETYIDFVFNISVKEKFNNFQKGFNSLMDENQIYGMFRPEELQKVVVGATVIDWHEVQSNSKYHDGYSAGHPSIKVFWSAFSKLSEEEKRKFLIFLTGSSRVPLGGLTMNIKFVNVTTQYLPVAHTCFNLLDLPPYTNVIEAVSKLRQAIQIQSGFQLV